MSEQVSRKHGPIEDEAIKRQDRHELEVEGEERPDADWLGADETTLAWAAEGRFADVPRGEDWEGVELRSELARHLTRADFPITGAKLAQRLAREQPSQGLLDRVAALPADARFSSLHELLVGLGLPIEHRAG